METKVQSSDLSDKDRRRVEKAAMLKEFETVKKVNLIAAILCAGLGYFGAHRFYLGHYIYGGLILAATLIAAAMIYTYNAGGIDSPIVYLGLGVMAHWLFEIYRISSVTDKINERLKRQLEDKYYT